MSDEKLPGGITGKGFVKNDPRINRKGRPKNFKQLRALAVSIAHETVKDTETVTRIEKMLRDMMKSDNPSDRALILKYAFGNVPDEVNVTQSGRIELHWPEDAADK